MKRVNHYKYLQRILPTFFKQFELDWENNQGIITAHADKCYSYRDTWEQAEIPFHKGVAIYLLTYVRPYSQECRDQPDGKWMPPVTWVLQNAHRFLPHLPDATMEDYSSI